MSNKNRNQQQQQTNNLNKVTETPEPTTTVTEEIKDTETPETTAVATETPTQETPAAVDTETTEVPEPPKQEPVQEPEVLSAKPVAQRPQAPVKTLKAAPVLEDVASIVNSANQNQNLRMQTLIQTLDTLEKNLSRRVQLPMDEVARNTVGLHTCLLNVINGNKTNAEFRQQWEYILKFFKEKENEGLSMNRVYRAVAFWPKSQDDYVHYQALLNLIYVTNNVDRDLWKKSLNFTRLTNPPVTEAGRGRLLSYYI